MFIKPDMGKVAEERKALESKGGKFAQVFTPRLNMTGNKMVIRILPPWTAEGRNAFKFYTEVFQHWNLSDSFKAPVTCRKHSKDYHDEGTDCAVCDLIDQLKASDRGDCKELAYKIRAKPTYLYNVINVADPVWTQRDKDEYLKKRGDDAELPFVIGNPKIQVFNANVTVHKAILALIDDNDGLDITDPELGKDLIITKSGSGIKDTKYTVSPKMAQSKAPVTPATWAPNILDKINAPMSVEKIAEVLGGGVGGGVGKLLGSGSVKSNQALPADSRMRDEVKKSFAATGGDDSDEDAVDLDDLEASLQ